MQLTLASQEHEILSWTVRNTISELGTEISHTDSQAMRQDLQERKKILSAILDRLMLTATG